jgi:ArsR family transcriptional regulator
MDPEALALACKALGHPTRIAIVQLLAAQTECRGADVFSGIPLAQSTISEHLRILKDAGVVRSRPEGTSAVYCVVPTVLESLSDELGRLACAPSSCR